MNILQLSKHMNDSGVNSHIIELSRLLTMYGHRVIVVSSGGTHVKELEKHNIKHYTIPLDTKNPLIQIKNIFLIIKIIKKEKIEIAHTHWRSTGILIKLASIFTGINFVWTNHSNNIPSNFLYRLFTFYGKYAITVSSDMVPLLNQKLNIPMNKIRIVYNGIDWTKYVVLSEERKKELRKRYNIINNEKVICLLGRLAPVKGHLFLLDALYDIKKHGKFKNYKILFTGNGSENYKNEIIKKAESYGLINNIIFTGYVNPAEILNISDLLVLPSENEGFAIVCIEAFALKVPVIRTKTGGYSDMKDQCIGVEYGDIAGLSNAITEVFLNSDKTLEMVNKAYKLYQDRLTSNKMVEAILEVYKDSMR